MQVEVKSRYLNVFIKEIQYKNRNPKDTKAIEYLDDISTNPERIIQAGSTLYRCRIIGNSASIGKEKGFYGYDKAGSFIPPVESTKDMRANYKYIPYLYCANNPYVALVEVRPRLGSKVSVASIHVEQDIRLLDFTIHKKPKKMKSAKQNLFDDLSNLFSVPVTSDDDTLDYIPTQYIAEYAKYLGYDGIMYNSSLTPEIIETNMDAYNIVVFNYGKCSATKSNVVKITRHLISCDQIDSDRERLSIHL